MEARASAAPAQRPPTPPGQSGARAVGVARSQVVRPRPPARRRALLHRLCAKSEKRMLEGEHRHAVPFQQGHRRRRIDAVVLEDDVPYPSLAEQLPGALQYRRLVALDVDLEQLQLLIAEQVV